MARTYPKFLYQEVKGTKSDGEYIIHLLEPRLLFKVEHLRNGSIELALMDEITMSHDIIEPILKRAKQWYISKQPSEK